MVLQLCKVFLFGFMVCMAIMEMLMQDKFLNVGFSDMVFVVYTQGSKKFEKKTII